ncbi:MAG: site-specific DNA-methyltransferase [Succinivibrio sp.]|nr:site-specific DNA-methyltransferase [Succinivibrio sp.]
MSIKALNSAITPVYQTASEALLLGDTFELLAQLEKGSVDLIFADPPYFLSNGGITCHAGKMVSVNKAQWDALPSDKHEFNRNWLRLCYDLLTETGTIWISGTLHNIYSIGMALEQEGFKILNNITWQKTNPPPNLACRCFTHSTETILWAKKNTRTAKHYFNYALMKEENQGKQMKDVWQGPLTPATEKLFGKHPTQKPLYLLRRIIESSSEPGQLILDPFCGSSTTGVAAKLLGRSYLGIDSEPNYIRLSQRRLEHTVREV